MHSGIGGWKWVNWHGFRQLLKALNIHLVELNQMDVSCLCHFYYWGLDFEVHMCLYQNTRIWRPFSIARLLKKWKCGHLIIQKLQVFRKNISFPIMYCLFGLDLLVMKFNKKRPLEFSQWGTPNNHVDLLLSLKWMHLDNWMFLAYKSNASPKLPYGWDSQLFLGCGETILQSSLCHKTFSRMIQGLQPVGI